MASRIKWTGSAWQELEHAADYIAQDSPRYAAAFVDEVRSAARSLRRFPNRGRVVPEVGDESVRELFVKSYRLIYEIRRAPGHTCLDSRRTKIANGFGVTIIDPSRSKATRSSGWGIFALDVVSEPCDYRNLFVQSSAM